MRDGDARGRRGKEKERDMKERRGEDRVERRQRLENKERGRGN
jgi:hypothetical protein